MEMPHTLSVAKGENQRHQKEQLNQFIPRSDHSESQRQVAEMDGHMSGNLHSESERLVVQSSLL